MVTPIHFGGVSKINVPVSPMDGVARLPGTQEIRVQHTYCFPKSASDNLRITWSHNPSFLLWLTFMVAAILALSHMVGDARGAGSGDLSGRVLTSGGRDNSEIIDLLKQVLKANAEADERRSNVLVNGRISSVNKPWKETIAAQSPADLPAPQWLSFTSVQKNGKKRYEQTYYNNRLNKEDGKYVSLMDGEGIFVLNKNSLEILGIKEETTTWKDVGDYFLFGRVHDGLKFVSVVQACQTYINRLDGRTDTDYWKTRVLRCYEEDGLLAFENDENKPGDSTHCRYVFWVDSKKGYELVKTLNREGGEGQPIDYIDRSEIQLSEAFPGVYVWKRAMYFTGSIGNAIRKRGQAGWLRRDLAVDDVKIEDFEYDEKMFRVASLDIPIGCYVKDSRYQPPLVFKHGIEPVDEEILRNAVKQQAKRVSGWSNSWPRYLLGSNVIIGGILIAWNMKHRRKGQPSQS